MNYGEFPCRTRHGSIRQAGFPARAVLAHGRVEALSVCQGGMGLSGRSQPVLRGGADGPHKPAIGATERLCYDFSS